jgi:hypothetical protein
MDKDRLQELIEEHRDTNVNDDWWYESTIENWKEDLKELGFVDTDIRFRGFSSQGEGASFTGKADVVDYILANKTRLIESGYNVFDLREIVNKDTSEEISYVVKRLSESGNYVHEYTIYCQLWDTWPAEDASVFTPEQTAVFIRLEEFIQDHARELSRKIYSDLEEEHEYQTSDEAVIEALKSLGIIDEYGEFTGEEDEELLEIFEELPEPEHKKAA